MRQITAKFHILATALAGIVRLVESIETLAATNPKALAMLAGEFWAGTGLHDTFPRKIEQAIAFKLPLALVGLSPLTVAVIGHWLQQRAIATRLPNDRRDLCGCLLAHGGHVFIFFCDADVPEEQRLTMAHETTHFLVDYLLFRYTQVCHMVYDMLNLHIISEARM